MLKAILALAALAGVVRADDRDLLRTSAADPYVFVLLDLSGSMTTTAACTSEQLARQECPRLCPGGGCRAPLDGDDPSSRLYQAKRALHQVLQQVGGLHLGFATFDQEDLRVTAKHWLYRSTTAGAALGGGVSYPPKGSSETFGRSWPCVSGGGPLDAVGCAPDRAAALDDPWALARVLRLPKLGDTLDTTVHVFVNSGGATFDVSYAALGGRLGDATLRVHVEARRCDAADGNAASCGGTRSAADVTYALVDQFIAWDRGASRDDAALGYFAQSSGSDATATSRCSGWSDLVPLDWRDDHRAEILLRLAPSPGDFGQAHAFADHLSPGESTLRLLDESRRPLVAAGGTPLAAALESFRGWYSGCTSAGCTEGGWQRLAAASDSSWSCRRKILLVITDGEDTCGATSAACATAAALRREDGVLTYVVGFGVTGGGDALACLAAEGGSERPLYPQSEAELVTALTATLDRVSGDARSFAAAAVPAAQADADDRVLLSTFVPIAGASTWEGHLDAYLAPLPLRSDSTPDASRDCAATGGAGCHLWDAAAALLAQAPTPTDAAAGDLRLGLAASQRRVLYPTATGRLRSLSPPAISADWTDLMLGLGLAGATDSTQSTANRARTTSILAATLAIKTATSSDASDLTAHRYVLGDVFHSDPVVLASPGDLVDFADDVNGDGTACHLGGTNRGYRCFAFQQQHRRRRALAGANDAQLHAFDAGTYDATHDRFGNGSGAEAFAFVPRMALPIVRDQAEGAAHVLGVDGALAVRDALLADGSWHTIGIGGLREGGRKLGGALVQQPESGAAGAESLRGGYYALDLTQPDPLREERDTRGTLLRFLPTVAGPVPGCTTLLAAVPAGCPRHFPTLLWEFRDTSPTTGEPLDENGNGAPDLAAPWSKPVLTRIRILTTDAGGKSAVSVRFVVVVGGGVDPAGKSTAHPASGNFVYILDAGTGAVLYKREVEGCVPAVAVLDEDGDHVADAIYAGTTAGRVYRIDLRAPAPLVPVEVRDRRGAAATVPRVAAGAWEPLLLFRTGDDTPIYEPLQILFVARLGRFALVFGTGDREDLWSADARRGRLYVVVDEGLAAGAPELPLDESRYAQVDPRFTALPGAADLLVAPPPGAHPGWYVLLDAGERVVGKAFGASGALLASTYRPRVETSGDGSAATCTRGGTSRRYLLRTTSGGALAWVAGGDPASAAYVETSDLVGAPFVEQAQTQNALPPAGAPNSPPSGDAPAASCTEDPRLRAIVDELERSGPPGARYGGYFLRLGRRGAAGAVVYDACIPIAITESAWKEN